MNYEWDPALTDLRQAVRSFRVGQGPPSAQCQAPADRVGSTWEVLADQLGVAGLTIPEEFGGAGAGLRYLAVVMEELGRGLIASPLLATSCLAAPAIVLSGDSEAQKRRLPALASGEVTATLAYASEVRAGGPGTPSSVVATPSDKGRWELGGEALHVLDGVTAGLVLVIAHDQAGGSLYAVAPDQPGLIRQDMNTLDETRPQARLRFEAATATVVGRLGEGSAVLGQVLPRAALALAAEQVGAAQTCLDQAVDYAKTRKQFGRPIGSYQAIKHRCADVHLEVECARAAVYYAAAALDAAAEDAAAAASVAASLAAEALHTAATEGIQIHGGIGFTWEHPAHLFFRRAVSSKSLFGDHRWHQEQVASWLLAETAATT